MIESQPDELFGEPKRSLTPMLLAGISALVITALLLAGYTLLRKRHAEDSGLASLSNPAQPIEARKPPKALVIIDEALLKQGKTTIGGMVRNTSSDNLEGISAELELRRRKDGGMETQLVPLVPALLEPQQEGRYALQLKAQDYSSARLVGLKVGPTLAALAYTTAPGQKRPPERLETKTIIVGKPRSKVGDFLNSPDNPARVP